MKRGKRGKRGLEQGEGQGHRNGNIVYGVASCIRRSGEW